MAIYVNPGKELGDAFAGIGAGVGKLAQHFMNPDKQYVDALRAALQKGTINAQELNNMTPEEISAKYKLKLENAKKFTTGKPDSKTLADRATSEEIQRIITSGTPEEKQEFLSRQTGTLTDTQRKREKAQTTSAENAAASSTLTLEEVRAGLKSENPDVRAAASSALTGALTPDQIKLLKAQVKTAETNADTVVDEATRIKQARVAGSQLLMKYGSKNLFAGINDASNQNQNAEMKAALDDEETRRVYESQRDDYWKNQQLALQKSIASGRDARQENDILLARKISERNLAMGGKNGVAVPVQAIMKVIADPVLQARYAGIKKEDLTPEEQMLWQAAQAVKSYNTTEGEKALRAGYNQLRIAAKSIYDKLNNPVALAKSGMSDEEINAAVNEYNVYARQNLGGLLPADEIPQIALDPGVDRKLGFIDKPFIKFIQGKDPLLNFESPKKTSTVDWDKVAAEIAKSPNPEAAFNESLADAKDEEERAKLRAAYAKVKPKEKK